MTAWIGTIGLRPHPADQNDLIWFFNEAHGELGLRAASYEPRVTQSGSDPDSPTGDPLVDRRAMAAERYRRIAATLTRMSQRLVRILQLTYGPRPRSVAPLVTALGELAPLASRTPTVRASGRTVDQLLADVDRRPALPEGATDNQRQDAESAGKADREAARARVAVIKAECQAMLAEASREYAECRPARRRAA